MVEASAEALSLRRVVAATDRSESADRAARWAANLAASYGADLVLLQVLPSAATDGSGAEAPQAGVERAAEELGRFAQELAGTLGRARVVVDEDPARAILQAIQDERADAIVVGNVGMAGRKQFLLGNIPNRISHSARCVVVIVNTTQIGDGVGEVPVGEASRQGLAHRAGAGQSWTSRPPRSAARG